MPEKMTPAEILANPKNLICTCEDNECRWHANCRDCVALHRFYKTIPNCLVPE